MNYNEKMIFAYRFICFLQNDVTLLLMDAEGAGATSSVSLAADCFSKEKPFWISFSCSGKPPSAFPFWGGDGSAKH